MDGERLRLALETARVEHGHLRRDDLVRTGWTRRMTDHARDTGLLVPVGNRTFRLGSEPPTWRGAVHAATLETGGVASHRTAAILHGLRPGGSGAIDVTVRRSSGRRSSSLAVAGHAIAVHTSTNLPAEDVLVIGGTPATSVARTLLGMAATVGDGDGGAELERLVRRALDDRLATLPWLWWLLEQRRCRGRDGVRTLEGVLASIERLAPTESWLERSVLEILREYELPLPTSQRVIRRSGRFVARVDFVYEAEKLVLEALGYQFHRTRAQMDADTRRANQLQLLGFDVLQFTYDTIVRDPSTLATDVAHALGR